ncbi:uncharacterized protein LOC136080949 [Hydra vulgaris]|uniref:Uncharacterized protein LOC136080949 n=1 Tax=Hydra vulgaris TaxID=6087 RepID=A0ABM4BYR3_HYDVU
MPTDNWRKHSVRILGTKESYGKAQFCLSKATVTSDLQSDAESQRLRPKRIQKYPAENYDSDSEDYYEQPQFKKSYLLPPTPIVNKEWNMIGKSDRTAKKKLSPSRAPTPPPFPDANQTLIKAVVSKEELLTSQIQNNCSNDSNNNVNREHLESELVHNAETVSLVSSTTAFSSMNATLNKIILLQVELKAAVNNLQKQVNNNTAMLQTLTQGGKDDDDDIFDSLDLPVCDIERLQQLEDALKQDKIVFIKLVKGVAAKGGQNLKEATKRMISSVINNEVAKKLNWTGQGELNKKSFRALKFCQVIEKAIRRNLPTKDATDSEIQKAIVAFLSGALDRNGGRKERAERKSILKASSTESRGNLNHTVQSLTSKPLLRLSFTTI